MTPRDPLKPNLALLSKLGSIIVHFDELLSVDGRNIDKEAGRSLMDDPEVRQWIKAMGVYLPLKRRTP